MYRLFLLLFVVVVVVVTSFPGAVRCDGSPKPNAAPHETDGAVHVENPGEAVVVHYMDVKRHEFIEQLPKTKEAIAKSLYEYCSQKENNCAEFDKFNISANNIEFAGRTEKEKFYEEGRFIVGHLKARIDEQDPYKRGDQIRSVQLSKEKLTDFMIKYREDIITNSGIQIAYVNSQLVYPPRNNIDNWIIVTVSCLFCLFLIVFNLVCQRKINKQAKEEFLKKAAELKPLVRSPVDYAQVSNSYEVTGGGHNTLTAGNSQMIGIVHGQGGSGHVGPSAEHRLSATTRQPQQQSISRHDSFDQKLDKLQASGGGDAHSSNSGKRRKKSRSGSNGSSGIAGNLGSGIGSPRNMAADDAAGRIRSANSYEHDLNGGSHPAGRHSSSSRRHLNVSSGSINRFAPPPQIPNSLPPSYYGYDNATGGSGGGGGEVQIPIQRVDSNFDRRNYQVETINVNEYPDPRVAYRLASN